MASNQVTFELQLNPTFEQGGRGPDSVSNSSHASFPTRHSLWKLIIIMDGWSSICVGFQTWILAYPNYFGGFSFWVLSSPPWLCYALCSPLRLSLWSTFKDGFHPLPYSWLIRCLRSTFFNFWWPLYELASNCGGLSTFSHEGSNYGLWHCLHCPCECTFPLWWWMPSCTMGALPIG